MGWIGIGKDIQWVKLPKLMLDKKIQERALEAIKQGDVMTETRIIGSSLVDCDQVEENTFVPDVFTELVLILESALLDKKTRLVHGSITPMRMTEIFYLNDGGFSRLHWVYGEGDTKTGHLALTFNSTDEVKARWDRCLVHRLAIESVVNEAVDLLVETNEEDVNDVVLEETDQDVINRLGDKIGSLELDIAMYKNAVKINEESIDKLHNGINDMLKCGYESIEMIKELQEELRSK